MQNLDDNSISNKVQSTFKGVQKDDFGQVGKVTVSTNDLLLNNLELGHKNGTVL